MNEPDANCPNAAPISVVEYIGQLDGASSAAGYAFLRATAAALDDLREMISAHNLTAGERISAAQSIAALATLLRPRQIP